MKGRSRKIFKRLTPGDIAFIIFAYAFVLFVVIVTLYPFLYVVSCSISDSNAVLRGEVWLMPVGLNFEAYKRVLTDPKLWRGFANTLFIVVFGTLFNIVLTTLFAYPLSRRNFGGRKGLMRAVTFTMFFGGGMIPSYLLVKNLGLINSRWALIIPGCISTYNLIVTRTFLEGISESLHEAAIVDGANEMQIFTRIYLPLSKAILATMTLFYAVGHWNNYFAAMLYLSKEKLYPLQIYLRNVLIQYNSNDLTTDVATESKNSISQTIRYATIVVTILPIICIYPFLQKYFVKGVMIGAIKE